MVEKDKAKALKVLAKLEKGYPGVKKFALDYHNPLELLVSTILSAQCTDARVNIVTKDLFKKYKTAEDYAKADLATFQKEIHSTGFYKNKAKNITNAAKILVKDFGGKVPDEMEDLLRLPGVARKTANIVLLGGFGKVEGIAVDTHVYRLSHRLGFSSQRNPNKVEKDLMGLFPRSKWGRINYLLISHGRAVCKARKPLCGQCTLNKLCPSAFKA